MRTFQFYSDVCLNIAGIFDRESREAGASTDALGEADARRRNRLRVAADWFGTDIDVDGNMNDVDANLWLKRIVGTQS